MCRCSDDLRPRAELKLDPLILLLPLAFVFVASLGILNLLIMDVLLTSALHDASKEDIFVVTTTRLRRHMALRALRELLIQMLWKNLMTLLGILQQRRR